MWPNTSWAPCISRSLYRPTFVQITTKDNNLSWAWEESVESSSSHWASGLTHLNQLQIILQLCVTPNRAKPSRLGRYCGNSVPEQPVDGTRALQRPVLQGTIWLFNTASISEFHMTSHYSFHKCCFINTSWYLWSLKQSMSPIELGSMMVLYIPCGGRNLSVCRNYAIPFNYSNLW